MAIQFSLLQAVGQFSRAQLRSTSSVVQFQTPQTYVLCGLRNFLAAPRRDAPPWKTAGGLLAFRNKFIKYFERPDSSLQTFPTEGYFRSRNSSETRSETKSETSKRGIPLFGTSTIRFPVSFLCYTRCARLRVVIAGRKLGLNYSKSACTASTRTISPAPHPLCE